MKSNKPTVFIDENQISHKLENSVKLNQKTDVVDENDLSHIDPATIAVIILALFFIPLILSGFFFQ